MKTKKQNCFSVFGNKKGIIFTLDAFLAIIIIMSLLPLMPNTNLIKYSTINKTITLNEFQDIISNLIEEQLIQGIMFGFIAKKSSYWNGNSLNEMIVSKINLEDGSINPCIDSNGFEEVILLDGNETFLEVEFKEINLIEIPEKIDLNLIYVSEENNFSNRFIKCFNGSSWINMISWDNSSSCTDKKEITVSTPNDCINSQEKLKNIKIRIGSSNAGINGRLFIDLIRLELDENILETEINNLLSKKNNWKITINVFKKTKEKEKTLIIGKELEKNIDIITGKNYFTINAGNSLQKLGEIKYELNAK